MVWYHTRECSNLINSAKRSSHQRPVIITPPSVGNKAEKQCLTSYKPHNLSASPLSLLFFVSLRLFIYSSLLMEVACWAGPSFAGFSLLPMKIDDKPGSYWATETDAYLPQLHGLRIKLHSHPGMAEGP